MTITSVGGGYSLGPVVLKGAVATADLGPALADWPKLTRTCDGASTLTLALDDHHRTLATSSMFADTSYADLEDIHFDLVAVSKTGDVLTLTFEDSLAAKLREVTTNLSIPAQSMKRDAILTRLFEEAGVPHLVQPDSATVSSVVERKDGANSWDLTGTLATTVGWRRFSDGVQVLAGSDAWLATLNPPVLVREFTGPVHVIDWELDVALGANRATLDVDVHGWVLLPGAPVTVAGQGLADGTWLVETLERSVGLTRMKVTLVREALVIPEPGPLDGTTPATDKGESGNVAPVVDITSAGIANVGVAANSVREAMVKAALAKAGTPYVWGASGPGSFDCSGLVQYATRAAGKTLGKPAASQYATCKAAGKTISVADALKTRGALLFRIGRGATNHVAISLGNGSTVEARGRAYKNGVFGGAARREWTAGGLWL